MTNEVTVTEAFPTDKVLPLDDLALWSDTLLEEELFAAVDVIGPVDEERIRAIEAEMERRGIPMGK